MSDKNHTLKFVFDNEKALKHFATWLCEQGEQEYWTWMEEQEAEEAGDITCVEFDYWGGTGSGKDYLKNNTIVATCGRLSDESAEED